MAYGNREASQAVSIPLFIGPLSYSGLSGRISLVDKGNSYISPVSSYIE